MTVTTTITITLWEYEMSISLHYLYIYMFLFVSIFYIQNIPGRRRRLTTATASRTWSGLHLPWRPSAPQWSHRGPPGWGRMGGWVKPGRNKPSMMSSKSIQTWDKICINQLNKTTEKKKLWTSLNHPFWCWNPSSLAAVFEPERTSDGNSCQCLARLSVYHQLNHGAVVGCLRFTYWFNSIEDFGSDLCIT